MMQPNPAETSRPAADARAVAAASDRDGPMEIKQVRPARPDSYP